jgi:hypothetical protein
VKGHLFKLMRPALGLHPDLRERLGKTRKDDYDEAEAICREMKERMDVSALLVFVSTSVGSSRGSSSATHSRLHTSRPLNSLRTPPTLRIRMP